GRARGIEAEERVGDTAERDARTADERDATLDRRQRFARGSDDAPFDLAHHRCCFGDAPMRHEPARTLRQKAAKIKNEDAEHGAGSQAPPAARAPRERGGGEHTTPPPPRPRPRPPRSCR